MAATIYVSGRFRSDEDATVNVLDHGHSSNRPLSFVNQLWNMFALG